jgi:sec-independent protein translocase protein TatA
MPSLGPAEIAMILAACLLLFGAKKLPGLARGMGESVRELRRSLREPDSDSRGEASDAASSQVRRPGSQ